ncbi:MAG: hypothetical protein ACRDYW_05675 [Acidimicrobiales bacterium]
MFKTARRNLAVVAGGLGLTVALLSGGIFAVFTDRATTGQNDATTRAEARAADLTLATADVVGAVYQCGDFVDDLATGIISVTDLRAGGAAGPPFEVCLRNDGSEEVTVEVSAIDLVDLDVACTGDEAAAGDVTCGGDQLGEASEVLTVNVSRHDCTDGSFLATTETQLGSNAQTSVPLPGGATLAPGDTACLGFTPFYSIIHGVTVVQRAQSDKATWRYAFDGTTT